MNRRSFLRSAGLWTAALGLGSVGSAGIAARVAEPEWVSRLRTTGVLENETLTVSQTLKLDDSFARAVIRNCVFVKDRDFNGPMIAVPSITRSAITITNCAFYDRFPRICRE